MKSFLKAALTLIVATITGLVLVGCTSTSTEKPKAEKQTVKEATKDDSSAQDLFKISVISDSAQAQILQYALDNSELKTKVELVPYKDSTSAWQGFTTGEVNADFSQPMPYFDTADGSNADKFFFGDPIVLQPLQLYSTKAERFDTYYDNKTVFIGQQEQAKSRAYEFLASLGLVTIDLQSHPVTLQDNRHNLQFISTQSDGKDIYDNYDFVVSTFAPEKSASGQKINVISREETKNNPYVNCLTANAKISPEKKQIFEELNKVLRSDKVRNYISDNAEKYNLVLQ